MELSGNIKIVILAAGKGKRMQSRNPKVLSPLNGKHLIRHLLEEVEKVSQEKPIVVVGYKAELVKKELGDACVYVEQKEQLGTGHAVLSTQGALADAKNVLVIKGEMLFISSKTIKDLLERHFYSAAKITVATTALLDFNDWREAFMSFGRIIRKKGEILIREYKDASPQEREIKEVNAGAYVFDAEWLWENLEKIGNDNAQKEYYLTDLLRIASEQKRSIKTVQIDPREALGANTKEELEILEKFT